MDLSPVWIGIYFSWVGVIVSLATSYHAVRQARLTRQHQTATESPHFVFSRLLIAKPAWKNAQGQDVFAMTDALTPNRQVPDDYPSEGPVYLCAINRGAEARNLKVISSRPFPTALSWLNQARGGFLEKGAELQIEYRFDPKRRGTKEKIHIEFETVGGERLRQSFKITHGALEGERL